MIEHFPDPCGASCVARGSVTDTVDGREHDGCPKASAVKPGDVFHTTVASLDRARGSWATPGLLGCGTFIAVGWPFTVSGQKYGHDSDVTVLPVAMVVNYADGETSDAESDFVSGFKPPSYYAPIEALEPGPEMDFHAVLAPAEGR